MQDMKARGAVEEFVGPFGERVVVKDDFEGRAIRPSDSDEWIRSKGTVVSLQQVQISETAVTSRRFQRRFSN